MTKLTIKGQKELFWDCILKDRVALACYTASIGIRVSHPTVNQFLLQYKISRSLITPDILQVVEAKMQADDEITVVQLLDLL